MTKKMIERWRTYFEEMSSANTDTAIPPADAVKGPLPLMAAEEVLAITETKNDKATGLNEILSDGRNVNGSVPLGLQVSSIRSKLRACPMTGQRAPRFRYRREGDVVDCSVGQSGW
ncbi:unnamed protein product [Strongylus vulgaris]|uniref:Uncharacterized protein n=1 Tax=Strongylus vulgaris TaxID=40348 RepID=A0A3P7I0D4_STRVU|nr:unnamed protein product [Strongylus vulgaris]